MSGRGASPALRPIPSRWKCPVSHRFQPCISKVMCHDNGMAVSEIAQPCLSSCRNISSWSFIKRAAPGLKLVYRQEFYPPDYEQGCASHSGSLKSNETKLILAFVNRSEERRVGKECVSTCRSRWSPYN